MPTPKETGLSARICRAFENALRLGELTYTEPSLHYVEDMGLKFRILVVKALEVKSRLAPSEFKDKDHQNKEGAIRADPFMPYEKNLFVGEIGAYNVILNKFPVIRNHFLLTTKEWKVQESPLNFEDFVSIVEVMKEDNEQFCVYNCGSESGASIIHKHIQFIPSHIDSGDDILPIYSLLKEKHNLFSHAEHKGIFKCKKLPFIHYFSYIPDLRSCNTEGETCSAVKECLERYKCAINACLNDAGLADESSTNISDDGIILDSEGKSFSHNFLLTSNWLLVVTRKVSEVRSLGFNSIAFTGEILVKNQEQLEIVRDLGPLNLLSSACYPQKNSLDSKSKLEAGGSIS